MASSQECFASATSVFDWMRVPDAQLVAGDDLVAHDADEGSGGAEPEV